MAYSLGAQIEVYGKDSPDGLDTGYSFMWSRTLEVYFAIRIATPYCLTVFICLVNISLLLYFLLCVLSVYLIYSTQFGFCYMSQFENLSTGKLGPFSFMI